MIQIYRGTGRQGYSRLVFNVNCTATRTLVSNIQTFPKHVIPDPSFPRLHGYFHVIVRTCCVQAH